MIKETQNLMACNGLDPTRTLRSFYRFVLGYPQSDQNVEVKTFLLSTQRVASKKLKIWETNDLRRTRKLTDPKTVVKYPTFIHLTSCFFSVLAAVVAVPSCTERNDEERCSLFKKIDGNTCHDCSHVPPPHLTLPWPYEGRHHQFPAKSRSLRISYDFTPRKN